MRSPDRAWRWLLRKEWRELIGSRAWWVFLFLMGPLVGVSFISAVRTYAEASGLGGTSAGGGEAFSPLVGIWAPTFSACEIASAFLLPFVAIRLVSGDRQSGALKLELQHPMSSMTRITAKALVLCAGWFLALGAAAMAVALWLSYGGSLYWPELTTVLLGHALNAGLTIALAAAAASLAEHPSTAAILTLAVTVGTWIIGFIAAVHGGFWERAVDYTPTAMVAQFQHGLVRLDVALIAVALTVAGLTLGGIWMRLGVTVRRRLLESIALGLSAVAAVLVCRSAHASWDTSENRMNSFSKADEQALRQIREPVEIEAHLAPEDPRRVDLEHGVFSKLRRTIRKIEIRYVSATSIGLFEQTNPHYGEICYTLGGHSVISRATTEEAVLATICQLAGLTVTEESDEDVFRGHPLTVPPKGAAVVFYLVWPGLIAVLGFISHRREQ